MKNDCKEIKNLIPLYVDDALTHIDAAVVKEHLKECTDCRQEYEFFKKIISVTASIPTIEPSNDFNEKLHNKLLEAKKGNRFTAIANFRKISVAAVAAVAVIAISVVSLGVLNDKEISVTPNLSASTIAPLELSVNRAIPVQETELPNEETKTEVSDNIQPEKSKKQNAEKKADATTAPKTEKSSSKSVSFENTIENSINDKTSIAPASVTPTQEKRTSGGGSSSPKTTVPKVSVPSKVKVTVNVTVSGENRPLAKQILSGYTYSNGAYSLSPSDYYSVMSRLDALGATTSMTREDKTSTYADLTGKLQTASKSEASSIQTKLNQIDSEISKTYVILN